MKKYIIGILMFSFAIFPMISVAEQTDIDPNLPASECVDIVNNLRYKDRDISKNNEVSTLQDFLQSQGYLNSEPTGYLGLLTVKAIKSFQKANDIAPSGYVGPVTRAKIKSITCDTTIPEPTTQKFNGHLSPIVASNIQMWGTHTLMVNESKISCAEEVCAQSAMAKSYPVKGEGSVFSDLKRYENSKVTIVGQLSWIDLEGGFWGIKAIRVIPSIETSTAPIIYGVSGPKSLTAGETGTWTVKAYDKGSEKLSYSVDWGEYNDLCNSSVTPCARPQESVAQVQQSATFTHVYALSGRYEPVFTVTNTSGKSTKTSISVKVGNVTIAPSVKVVSPNGGESLTKGQKKSIYWKDNITSEANSVHYKISLVPYSAPCNDGYVCPMMPVHAPYLIAEKAPGSSFGWIVGDVIGGNGSSDQVVQDGAYQIQVCRAGTEICDSSDSFFKIASPTTQPVISGVSGPQTLNVNQTGTWTVSAYDKNGEHLSYSVSWGDENEKACDYLDCFMMKEADQRYQQTGTFTHSYSQVGIYTPIFIVTNTHGQSARTKLSVNVGGTIPSSSITVLSPNSGETLIKGSTKAITWKDNVITTQAAPSYYDINLNFYYPPCTSTHCPTMLYRAPYKIIQGVSGYSYNWPVGDVMNNSGEIIAENGTYQIEVCRTGTGVCDLSDSFFTIQ